MFVYFCLHLLITLVLFYLFIFTFCLYTCWVDILGTILLIYIILYNFHYIFIYYGFKYNANRCAHN